MSTRHFAASLLVLAIGCAGSTTPDGPVAESAASLKDRQALYLDGEHVAWITHVDQRGRETEIAITSMTKPIHDWVRASLNMTHERKNGSIVTSDFGAIRRRDLVDARITSITFPDADGPGWKTGALVLRLGSTLSPARDASELPAPAPIASTIPRVRGVSCNCNAVSIRNVAITGPVVTAVVDVPGTDPTLEFTAAEPQHLSFDLQFDDFEDHVQLVDVTVIDDVLEGSLNQPDGGAVRSVSIRATLMASPNG